MLLTKSKLSLRLVLEYANQKRQRSIIVCIFYRVTKITNFYLFFLDPCGFNPCDSNANCTYVMGSNFTCTCLPGFSGNGSVCMDIDECSQMAICSPYADCENNNGSFVCTCDEGFRGDGFNCTGRSMNVIKL